MEEKNHGAITQTGPAMAPKLEVVAGENAGETFKVKLKTTIGRERDNDVVIIDPKMSRHHAQIELESGQWLLTDLGSANGTYLNDVAVTGPTPLPANARIRVGETELAFKVPLQVNTEPASLAASASPAPAKAAPVPTPVPVKQETQPRLLWIASGVTILLCFAAVLVIYLATRLSPTEEPVAANETPPAGETASSENNINQEIQPPPAPAELALAYEDDFSDSFGGWDDAFDTYTRKVYGNNRYQIEVNASNLVAWGLANRDVADFEVQVEARQESGDAKNSYGLLFRFQDRDNFYRFDISGDGHYLLSKFVEGQWFTLVDWTPSENINQGTADNILKVSAFGPNITIWANGQALASVTDDSLTRGNFGFFAGTFAEPTTWVSFDNLKMWLPPGEEIRPIPTATRPGAVAFSPVPTPTPALPTLTPTPQLNADASETDSEEETEATPTVDVSPSPTPEPTETPVPLPEYASRDQTLARGEERATGRVVFPVYDAERGTYDVYIADIADGGNRELVQENASQPALTIDGAEIVYRSWQPDKRGLFARPLQGDPAEAWGFDLFFESARPQFSPVDGSLMYHSRTGGKEPAIYRVIDGVGQVMRRESVPVQGKASKWSPDGQQFVYSSCLGSTCGIILSNADGNAPVLLTDHPTDTNPEISPDGKTVVFMSERAGNWEIYRIDIDGNNLVALTSDKASDGLPTWSPDGEKIAFVSNSDGEWAIWDMDPNGDNQRRHFVIGGPVDGVIRHDVSNSYGWVEENIDWIP
jgi:TolB protein